ncbi:MAG: CPBP family intramembrane metalloprotease [Micromonosporaceae bacterium]|nr:CPBP family intramembrane metalloprotease [Micromonosporaceae bacterium]
MPTIRTLIARAPLMAYFLLTFVVSWGCILLAMGPQGLWDADRFEEMVPVAVLALLAGPSVASIVTTALLEGRPGLRSLWRRLRRWRVGLGWYGLALLTAPVVVTVTLLVLSLASRDFLPAIFTADDRATLLLSGIAAGVCGGFLEELGWTGFATPHARRRFGVLGTGVLVGVVWGLWHLPPAMWGSGSGVGDAPLVVYVVVALFGVLLPYRLLIVCVHERTQSLLLAVLMHVALIPSMFYVLTAEVTGWAFVTYYLAVGGMFWGVAAVLMAGRTAARRLKPSVFSR